MLQRILFSGCAGALLWPVIASAQVTQPTGEIMPMPVAEGEMGIVEDRGFPGDAVTLEGLFKYQKEPLDPVADAKTEPGVFSPLCGFTGTLLLRGGSCKVAFGWYNVTPGSVTPPPDDQIYELVPADTSLAFKCDDEDFCPLATTETTQAPQHGWVPVTFTADNIRKDSRYKGGLVGFALKGGTDEDSWCPQTKFSQAELNVRSPAGGTTMGKPWITTLIYESVATPNAFYIAFEDLPVSTDTWRGGQDGEGNDGDFNDFVYFITGLTCDGGGQLCDASATNPALKGVCAVGRTGCATGGAKAACNPIVQPGEERCDNLDNDCDGLVDDGDLCPERQVCDKGTCVGSCTGGEIRCDAPLVCNANGFCVEPACKDIACQDGQVCREGVCSGGCGPEVKCPMGQECQLGRCIDPCAGTKCGDNQVCEQGVCVSNCQCRPCGAGKQCADMGPEEGRCVDEGCGAKSCTDGTRCIAGECVDVCAGVACPGGATCTSGVCGDPLPPAATGGRGGRVGIPSIETGDDTGTSAGSGGSGTSAGSSGTGANPSGAGAGNVPVAGSSGGERQMPAEDCNCRVPGGSTASGWYGLAALGLAVGVGRRRTNTRVREAGRLTRGSRP